MDKSKFIVLDSLEPGVLLKMHYSALFDQIRTGIRKISVRSEFERLERFDNALNEAVSLMARLSKDAEFFSSRHRQALNTAREYVQHLENEIREFRKSGGLMEIENSPAQFLFTHFENLQKRSGAARSVEAWVKFIFDEWFRLGLIGSPSPHAIENEALLTEVQKKYESARTAVSVKKERSR